MQQKPKDLGSSCSLCAMTARKNEQQQPGAIIESYELMQFRCIGSGIVVTSVVVL